MLTSSHFEDRDSNSNHYVNKHLTAFLLEIEMFAQCCTYWCARNTHLNLDGFRSRKIEAADDAKATSGPRDSNSYLDADGWMKIIRCKN